MKAPTFKTLAFRSLTHHFRSHAGVLIGVAIGSAALVGALVVGDSVRLSLREMAMQRVGDAGLALFSSDRFFRDQLASDLARDLTVEEARISASLLLNGTAISADGEARANNVQVLGVTPEFWQLAPQPPGFTNVAPGQVVLNRRLAGQMQAEVGDTLLLRMLKPSALSRDAAISPQADISATARLTVQAIVNDAQFGRFSLQANQVPPYSAFMNLGDLQERIELPGRANLMLVQQGVDADSALLFLEQVWEPADAELELQEVAGLDVMELRSSRVFLDEAKIEAALQAAPGGRRVLTYFANELSHGTNTTPYSMIASAGPPLVPDEVATHQMIINEWLAEDLNAGPGDTILIRYYLLDAGRELKEETAEFEVHSVVPLEGRYADRTLMPEFPGVADAERTRDWNAGFELDVDRIRPKDEDYWEEYKGTPKAFVKLEAGQQMWANRFGDVTSLRWPLEAVPGTNELGAAILDNLNPADVGLQFQPIRDQALLASTSGIDFGGLFIGFSLFLIVAALLLVALLFQFGLEQRGGEIGTYLALGFRPREVRKLLLGEGFLLACIGSVIGAAAGIAYAAAMMRALTTVWRDAVSTSALSLHVQSLTVIGGVLAGILVAVLTLFLTLRKQASQPARELLNEGGEELRSRFETTRGRKTWISAWISLAAALALMASAFTQNLADSAGEFFGVGALILVSGLLFLSGWFHRINLKAEQRARTENRPSLSITLLGIRNATRRRKRSLATAALLASGTFLIIAIAAFRLDAETNAGERSSGTGGFALIGQSSLPVTHDLNTREGRDFYGLDEETIDDGVRFVQFRVREGDEASCLNLNRAQQPRLLGVNPKALADREAFTFAEAMKNADPEDGWTLLNGERLNLPEDEIPAIGDKNSITYAMGKAVGEAIEYEDAQGRTFKVRIVGSVVNSILQGQLIISESDFIERFPGESGYRMFLIDAPSNNRSEVREELTRGLSDAGLELTGAAERLNEFNAVQNTYLSTFQILGGLGLLLGSAGLGVVVLRNVLERRAELGLMMAIGFRKREMQRLVLREHGLLLALGLILGVVTALIAIMPAMVSPGSGGLPRGSLVLTLTGVILNGLLWTWAATRFALRGELLAALRNE